MSFPCWSRRVLLPTLLALALSGCSGEFEVRGPDAPKVWEKTAVEELNHYLGLCAEGRRVTVGWRGAVFHVGDTAFARAKGLFPDSFKDEEWCIKSFGRDVVLAGGGTRGTLYAVYRFLEDDCGVRWWMDGDEDVPSAKPLKFDALDRRGKPFFPCRNIYRFRTSGLADSGGAGRRVYIRSAVPRAHLGDVPSVREARQGAS